MYKRIHVSVIKSKIKTPDVLATYLIFKIFKSLLKLIRLDCRYKKFIMFNIKDINYKELKIVLVIFEKLKKKTSLRS